MTVTRCKQKGLTLLETILALAVGVVIIMGVLMYFQTASDNANMTSTIKIVGDIGTAVRAYAQSPDYKPGSISLATLQSAGLLTGAATVNPWSVQGNSLKVTTNGNYLGINFYNVPAKVNTATKPQTKAGGICGTLALQLSNALPMPSPGTVTLGGIVYTITVPGGVHAAWSCSSKTCQANSQGAAACQYTSGQTMGTLSILMDLT